MLLVHFLHYHSGDDQLISEEPCESLKVCESQALFKLVGLSFKQGKGGIRLPSWSQMIEMVSLLLIALFSESHPESCFVLQ
jgi:hypothetical protein